MKSWRTKLKLFSLQDSEVFAWPQIMIVEYENNEKQWLSFTFQNEPLKLRDKF